MRKVSFVIASPSFLMRSALDGLIQQRPHAEVVKQITNNFMLTDQVQHYRPDYAILDTALLRLTNDFNLINEFPGTSTTRFIALSPDQEYGLANAKFYDVISYLEEFDSIHQKIETWVNQLSHDEDDNCSSRDLSKQEKKVLQLLALGQTNKEVAEKLFISTHTVMTHRKNITRKLGIKTVSGLTVYAILNKLVDVADIQRQV
ncbi:MAG: response regulator transcription factor [Bacteroidales bacterium]|nr:response regulator transcription factor [Bacteroidales bacterium]